MTYRATLRSLASLSLVAVALACNGGGGGESDEGTGTNATTGGTDGTGSETSAPTTGGTTGAPASPVVLNEVVSRSPNEGPYEGRGDAVEIYNAGDAIIDLSGWKLSDDPGFPADKTYVFPKGTSLAPGGYLVLTELDVNGLPDALPFGISTAAEETVTLVDAGGNVADVLTLKGSDAVDSWCRVPDGSGTWQHCAQTLGAANAAATAFCGNAAIEPGEACDGANLDGQTCENVGLGYSGGTLACSPTCALDGTLCTTDSLVVINELDSVEDRIEVYNAGPGPVDIGGWILTDRLLGATYNPDEDLERLVFPTPSMLAPGEYLVIGKGELPGQHPFGLSAEGDTVSLLRPDLTVADQVTYRDGEAEVSFCALPDGPNGTWTAGCKPTFGYANALP